MGKNVIITGASSGIGEALARAFAAEGHNLGLAARRTERLEALARELEDAHHIKVVVTALDVQRDDTVAAALGVLAQDLGPVDIVVANAGITGVRRSGSGDISTDKAVFQTNLIGAVATLDAATRIFNAQGFGHLVGISSVSAFFPIPGSAAYSASKAALTNYMNAMRLELAKKKIDVTVIHPGFIKTDIAPGMEKYPFVIEADAAAKQMLAAIAAKKANAIVPALPWKPVKGLMSLMPDSVMTLLFTKFMK
ncbi:short-subunit dehydrogenase [Fluviicoccus keumensis]|uniref:Short-subunit dehydrogenase n=1 Tax=Fluviicoccus keumensis TaxID=1435465 RepID=A0A4Q7YLW7_9GAMM|nr:SDR family oxidoreductase [Fluviicoccus keumensis]RZU38298.1 short-subunit dehydrogenase [Fluviicoccus keumensis]